MKFILFKKSADGYYSLREGNNSSIYVLGSFLENGSPNDFSAGWRELILSKKQNFCSGMVTFLEWDDNEITLSDIWSDIDVLTEENSITMFQKEFFDIFDRWDELCNQTPDEIIFTQEGNGKIFIVGKFADGREI